MKTKNLSKVKGAIFIAAILFVSCNRIDFTKPEEVVKGFKQIANKNESENIYDNFLSLRSKEFVSKDEFEKDQAYPDSVIKKIKIIDKKITEIPVGENSATYRRFKIDETVLYKKDTVKTRNYYTLINENGKWKVIWVNTLISLADQKRLNGNYLEARKTIEKVIDINPFDGSAYDIMAICYLRDRTLSPSAWEKGVTNNIKYALVLEKDCHKHYNTLASYYSGIKEYDLALGCYLSALNYCLNEKDKTILLSNIGSSYVHIHKYQEAYNYYTKAVQINPKYTDAWYRLGLLMEDENDIQMAIKYFEKALTLPVMENDFEGSLYFEYAKCCYETNRCAISKEYINKALVVDPSNAEYQELYNEINSCRG